MGVIAKNKEDYISFSIKVEVDKYIDKYIDKNGIEKSKEIELRFIDSFKFMNSSLDSLVNNLARRGGKFFGFEEYNKNYSFEKESIPMNIGLIGISLKKRSSLQKKLSIVNLIWLGLEKKIMNTLVEFGKSLDSKIWGIP